MEQALVFVSVLTYPSSRFCTTPLQTYEGLAQAFDPEQVQGVQEEVQLREQDFG